MQFYMLGVPEQALGGIPLRFWDCCGRELYVPTTPAPSFSVLHAEKQEGPGTDYLHTHKNYPESLVIKILPCNFHIAFSKVRSPYKDSIAHTVQLCHLVNGDQATCFSSALSTSPSVWLVHFLCLSTLYPQTASLLGILVHVFSKMYREYYVVSTI